MVSTDKQVFLNVLMHRTKADELRWEQRSQHQYLNNPGWDLNFEGYNVTLSKWPSLFHRYWSLRIWGHGVDGIEVAKRGKVKELVALLSEKLPCYRTPTEKEQVRKAIDTFRDK